MILSDKEIRRLLSTRIFPWREENLNPNSYNITLGKEVGECRPTQGHKPIDPQDKNSYITHKFSIEGGYVLKPGEFLLAEMEEEIDLPRGVCADVRGRSSLGRLGLINSSHAGLIDAGFGKKITLELYNSGRYGIVLRPGMSIGQLEFQVLEPEPEVAYGEKPTSRYYNQAPLEGSKGV